MKRTFLYGETSLPENTGDVTADAPDPNELKENGITVAVVPGVGHQLMIVNPDGFIEVLRAVL